MTSQHSEKGPWELKDSHIAVILICVGVFFAFGGIYLFAYFDIIKGFSLWVLGLVIGLTLLVIGIVFGFKALK